MKTKILGRTGLEVTVVGLGTAFLGMPPYDATAVTYEDRTKRIDEDLGVATVHAALEAGCTLIDTAALYGGTRAEAMIGRALKERPDLAAKCTVTTKAGRLVEGQDYSFEAIVHSVNASLERLGLDRFEVVFIHDQMDMPMEQIMGKDGALGALRKLQADGLVGHIGTAANDPEANAPYIETGEFDAAVIADAWSLLNQTAARRILPAAAKHNVGIVTATPLERGLLATGPIAGSAYFDRTFSPACLNHVAKIQQLCRDYEVPLVAVALQWCSRHPQIATTIPGAQNPPEAIENAQAASVEIPDAFWNDLEPLVQHWDQGVHR